MTTSATQPRAAESVLLRQDEGGITTLTLNRPGQYNALSEEMLTQLQATLDAIAKNSATRVVVLAGAGTAFCAGHDLKQMRANPDRVYYRKLFQQCSKMMLSITELPQPVIARVHGLATAAGCQLVANCDLAVASTEARFAVSGVNLGLFCATPSVALSRNISRKRALEMLLTGEFIDAETAARYGLVNRTASPDSLDNAVYGLAKTIAEKPEVAVRMGKSLFYRQINQAMASAYEDAGEVMACNMMDADTVEGIDAFIEKRDPNRPNKS